MDETTRPRRFKVKGLISLLAALSFLGVLVSGLVLYATPKGRVANWTNWKMLGLSKDDWSAIHINIALLFVVACGVHLWLNWRTFWSYLRIKAAPGLKLKYELPVALIVTLLVLAGTFLNVPPFSSIMAINDEIKAYWARNAPRAPVPHAESLSLDDFAGYIRLSPEDVMAALRQEGFVLEGSDITLLELAEQKGVSPSDVHTAIKKHFPESGPPDEGRGGGQGRRGDGQGRRGGGQGRREEGTNKN